jgi:hypothetical protein
VEMRLKLNRETQLRAAAAGSLAFTVIFAGLQFYLSQLLHGDHLPQSTGKQDADAAALLRFVHSHAVYFSTGYALTALNFLFLLAPVYGAYVLLRGRRDRTLIGVTLLGAASSIGVAASQVVASHQWLDWADNYAAASGAAAQLRVVHGFENSAGAPQLVYLLCSTGLALWLALLGLILLRREGRRSVAAWASLAAGLLNLSQLPVLPVWTLGAAISFWRGSDTLTVPAPTPSQSLEPLEPPAGAVRPTRTRAYRAGENSNPRARRLHRRRRR